MNLFKDSDCILKVNGEAILTVARANAVFNERMKVGYCDLENDEIEKFGNFKTFKDQCVNTNSKIYYITEEIEKEESAEDLLKQLSEIVSYKKAYPDVDALEILALKAKKLLQKKGNV